MSQVQALNEVTRFILNMDLGTDTMRVRKCIERGSEALQHTLGALLTVASITRMNQKAVMRAVQAVSYAVSGDKDDFDPVTASAIAAVMLTADARITFEALRYVSGQSGIVNPASINGVSRMRFARFIGRGGTAKTIESKVSRSVGVRGFLTALGVVDKSDTHSFTLRPDARANAFVVSYASQLQSMTEGQFALIFEDK